MREPAWAAGVVTNCTEAHLRAALAGGGAVSFACDGTITLSNTITLSSDTILDATGHQITISGNNAVRVFAVPANAALILNHLTIANGTAPDTGGGLWNLGKVNATDCAFRGNTVSNQTQLYYGGGAIYNDRGGTMNLDSCRFTNNGAVGGLWASLKIGDLFGSVGCNGMGGAIYNRGTLVIHGSDFAGNWANGGGPGSFPGYNGGDGMGGAICNFDSGSSLWLESCTIESNSTQGGGGAKGASGSPYMDIATDGSPGGPGGRGLGGALYNAGNATAINSTFVGNRGWGGAGGTGGDGGHGQLIGGNGGPGGVGGNGQGAIYDANGLLHLTDCTLASNSGFGGAGGAGGTGGGHSYPGGHSGGSGSSGNGGTGAGGIRTSGGFMVNTLLAANSGNCSGTVTDGGHNLSSDATCAFTNVGSVNNTDPQLGPLADNGGPTLTMALLAGSPAIDTGSALGAPVTDQRGVPRPQGVGVDIGAFEYLYSPVFTDGIIQNATNRQMQLCGLTPNPTLTLQVSTDLLNWWDVTNFMAGSNGVFQCIDPTCTGGPARFYRLKSNTP